MFRNLKQMGRWIAIAVAIGLVCSSAALAKKPPKPPPPTTRTTHTTPCGARVELYGDDPAAVLAFAIFAAENLRMIQKIPRHAASGRRRRSSSGPMTRSNRPGDGRASSFSGIRSRRRVRPTGSGAGLVSLSG